MVTRKIIEIQNNGIVTVLDTLREVAYFSQAGGSERMSCFLAGGDLRPRSRVSLMFFSLKNKELAFLTSCFGS